MSRRFERPESGIATVAAVTTVALVLAIAFAMVQVGLVIAGKHRAEAAADLAALAGSSATLRGLDGCARAKLVVHRNGAELIRCRADLAVVTVTAGRATPTAWGGSWRTTSTARAAPDFYVTSHAPPGRAAAPSAPMP